MVIRDSRLWSLMNLETMKGKKKKRRQGGADGFSAGSMSEKSRLGMEKLP